VLLNSKKNIMMAQKEALPTQSMDVCVRLFCLCCPVCR
jgi:hypothetical protein